MYSTRTTPRIISSTSLDGLGFSEIANVYSNLFSLSKNAWNHKRKLEHERLIARYDDGDAEGAPIDVMLDSKYGTACTKLGTVETAQFEEFLTEWASRNRIINMADSVFAQMQAKFNALPLVRNEAGLIDPVALYKEIRNSSELSGMLLVCKHSTRSLFIKGQTDVKYRDYCSLVPIILASFKKLRNINYKDWQVEGLSLLIDPKLMEAMTFTNFPDMTKAEVLEAREVALTPKSGTKMGRMNNPATSYTLYFTKESGLSHLPPLVRTMFCQTWCAHPINRTRFMILSTADWDAMPEELLSPNLFSASVSPAVTYLSDW